MTFDPTQPTDTTKIRDLGTVIRPNWVAIENGDSSFKPLALNLDNRTVAGSPVNPTAIADAYILYCKTDTAGNSEVFGIDENSNVIQMTKGVPTVAATGKTFLPGGLLLLWGQSTVSVPPAGTTVTISGITTIYNIQLTVISAAGTAISANASSISGNTFVFNSNTSVVTFMYSIIGV